jgi:NAD(P)H-nitrite reductase large subunit
MSDGDERDGGGREDGDEGQGESHEPMHPAIRGLKTICRCNNIKYRTIERAIREGAHTLNQVAARTTATTGECGGSCTPEVQALIAELAPKYATAGMAPKGQPAPQTPPAAQGDAWWVRKK